MNFNEAIRDMSVGRKTFYNVSDIIARLNGEVDIALVEPLNTCLFTIIDIEVPVFNASSKPSEIALIECRASPGKIFFKQVGPLTLSNADEMKIAELYLQQIMNQQTWLVAHNASSDQRYLSNIFKFMRDHKRWFCTLKDIRWENYGYNAKNLEYLLFKSRLFYEAHNSLQDAQAVLALLTAHPKELIALQLDQSVIKIANIRGQQANDLICMGYDVSLKNLTAKVIVNKAMIQAEIENLVSIGIDRHQITFI